MNSKTEDQERNEQLIRQLYHLGEATFQRYAKVRIVVCKSWVFLRRIRRIKVL
jgi:hypothetical protein